MSKAAHKALAGVRVIGFDLDQTLYPKSPAIDERIQTYLYEKIAEHKHITQEAAKDLFREQYRGGAGLSGRQALTVLGLPNPAELVQEALERADLSSVIEADPEVAQLLADVRGAYDAVDLLTGSDLVQARHKLAALGLSVEDFKNVITADQAAKSSGDAYHLWLGLYPSFAPEQFLYVGDRITTDHTIPSSLGIHTALVYVATPDPAVTAIQLPDLLSVRKLLLAA